MFHMYVAARFIRGRAVPLSRKAGSHLHDMKTGRAATFDLQNKDYVHRLVTVERNGARAKLPATSYRCQQTLDDR